MSLLVVGIIFLTIQHAFSSQSGIKVKNYYAYTTIESRFATTVISSELMNDAENAGECKFALDLPVEAFISKFTMKIDGNTIVAKVMEANEAEGQYNNSIKQNKTAGLVFRKNETLFTVSTNIGSYETIVFELTYQQVIAKTGGGFMYIINLDRTNFQPETDVQAVVKIMEQGQITVTEKSPPDSTVEITPGIMYSTATVRFLNISTNHAPEKIQVSYKILDNNYTMEVANGYFVHFISPALNSTTHSRNKQTVLVDIKPEYPDTVDKNSLVSQITKKLLDIGTEQIVVGKLLHMSSHVANLTVIMKARDGSQQSTARSRMWICSLHPVISEVEADECCVFPPCTYPEPSLSPDTAEPGILEKLWAHLTIKDLLRRSTDVKPRCSQALREKALSISLKYNLVTELTSLVVVLPDTAPAVNVAVKKVTEGRIYGQGSSTRGYPTTPAPRQHILFPLEYTTTEATPDMAYAPPLFCGCNINVVFVTMKDQTSTTNCPAAVMDKVKKLSEMIKDTLITISITVIAMDGQTGFGAVTHSTRAVGHIANVTCPEVQVSQSIRDLLPTIEWSSHVKSFLYCDNGTTNSQVTTLADALRICNAPFLYGYKEWPASDPTRPVAYTPREFCVL